MTSMADVIVPKSDQLNADDLIAGDLVVRITGVKIRGGEEQPVSIEIEGHSKVYRPCKSMSRVLVGVWGPDANKYVGRSLRLYRDPTVKWAGMQVGGIRISEMSDMAGGKAVTLALTETRGQRKPAVIKPLVMQKAAPGAEPPAPTDDAKATAIAAGRAAARGGTDAFRAWWNTDEGKVARANGLTVTDEIKRICAEADAIATEKAAADADPFGAAPADQAPSDLQDFA